MTLREKLAIDMPDVMNHPSGFGCPGMYEDMALAPQDCSKGCEACWDQEWRPEYECREGW